MQESLKQLREAAKDEDRQVQLLYFDESGMSNVPSVQRSWSPLAKPHSADASIGRKRINILGALNYAAGTLAFEVHEHSVCRQDVGGEFPGQTGPQLGRATSSRWWSWTTPASTVT